MNTRKNSSSPTFPSRELADRASVDGSAVFAIVLGGMEGRCSRVMAIRERHVRWHRKMRGQKAVA